MDAFDYAYAQTGGLEGGEVNDPLDRGGHTIHGITETTFREALRRGVISGVDRLQDLTPAQEKAIYKTMYWHEIRLGEIRDICIAAEIFDTGVNSGTGRATFLAQLALEYLGEKLAVDGIMGSGTIGLLNKWCAKDPRALMVALNGFQFIHYVAIIEEDLLQAIMDKVKSDSSQVRFARGWTKRIQEYRKIGG